MKFTYSSEFRTQEGFRHTSLELATNRIYATFEGTNGYGSNTIKKICIHNPTTMRLDETHLTQSPYNGKGHFTTINGIKLHPNAYNDILQHYFSMPDFFSGANVVTLSDRILTIFTDGLEVQYTTRLKHDHLETLPIRFFESRIHSIEGGGKCILHGVGYTQQRYTILINGITMYFIHEEEYTTALSFLLDTLFSAKDLIKDLLTA